MAREIQILPEWQRRGVGSRLLQDIARAAHAQAKPVRLQVLKQSGARAWYARFGFAREGATATHDLLQLAPPE
ncbi:MAG: GNAT family N-acetyltransferase [Planctomycetota bacterium]